MTAVVSHVCVSEFVRVTPNAKNRKFNLSDSGLGQKKARGGRVKVTASESSLELQLCLFQ